MRKKKKKYRYYIKKQANKRSQQMYKIGFIQYEVNNYNTDDFYVAGLSCIFVQLGKFIENNPPRVKYLACINYYVLTFKNQNWKKK